MRVAFEWVTFIVLSIVIIDLAIIITALAVHILIDFFAGFKIKSEKEGKKKVKDEPSPESEGK